MMMITLMSINIEIKMMIIIIITINEISLIVIHGC